jgi:hypothetical protein
MSESSTSDAKSTVPASSLPRRRRGLRLFGGLMGMLTVVAGFVVPWVLSSPDTIAVLIQSSLRGAETDVSVEAARIGWFGPTVIEGVALRPRDGSPQTVSIERVEGERGLLSMLFSLGDLGRFRLNGCEIDVVFQENRQSNLRSLIARDDDASDGDPTRRQRRALVSTEIEVEQAIVRIAGPWTEGPWVSKPIDLDLVLEPDPGYARSRWRIGKVDLLEDAVLDPSVSQGVLAYIAPVLADTTIVGGRFSLSLESASLPVGDPGSGTVEGRLVMHEVEIGPGKLVNNILALVPVEKPKVSSLRVSESSDIAFGLADRRVRHKGLKFGVPLPKSGKRLDIESSGTVGIDDQTLDLTFSVPLPEQLLDERPVLRALAGGKISLAIGGTFQRPEVNMDGTLRSAIAGLLGGGALNSASRGDPQTSQTSGPSGSQTGIGSADTPLGTLGITIAEQVRGQLPGDTVNPETAEAVVNLVGGILDEVGRRRATRASMGKEDPHGNGTAKGDGGGVEAASDPKQTEQTGERRQGFLKRLRDRFDGGTTPQSSGMSNQDGPEE